MKSVGTAVTIQPTLDEVVHVIGNRYFVFGIQYSVNSEQLAINQ